MFHSFYFGFTVVMGSPTNASEPIAADRYIASIAEAVFHRSTAPGDSVTLSNPATPQKENAQSVGRWCVLFIFRLAPRKGVA